VEVNICMLAVMSVVYESRWQSKRPHSPVHLSARHSQRWTDTAPSVYPV
jgi:hypothetical protein